MFQLKGKRKATTGKRNIVFNKKNNNTICKTFEDFFNLYTNQVLEIKH